MFVYVRGWGLPRQRSLQKAKGWEAVRVKRREQGEKTREVFLRGVCQNSRGGPFFVVPHNGVHAAPENLDHCGATPPKVPNQGGGGAQEFSKSFAWRKSGSTLPLRAERGNQKREVRPESGDMPQETLMRPRGRRSRYTTDTPAAQTKRKHQLKAYPKGGAGSGSGWGWLRRGVNRRKKKKKG